MKHMETNNLFTSYEHGFHKKRSCVTQLLKVIEEWSSILEHPGSIDCVYIDFAKAKYCATPRSAPKTECLWH